LKAPGMTNTILLIQPPIRDFYLTKKRTIPYGLISIAASLIDAGFTVKLLDGLATSKTRIIELPEEMNYLQKYYGREDLAPFSLFHHFRHHGYSFQHIAKLVKASNPFLVGISSLFSPYAETAQMTAEIARKSMPTCRIVLGGHHATAMPSSVMDCEAVDFVLRGDGEASMPLLAESLLSKKDLKNIPGIVYRQPDDSLHISPPAWISDLDALALPAAPLLNFSYYRRGKKASYVIVASRGCPLECSYCSVGKHAGSSFRQRPVSSIIHEMKTVVTDFNVTFFDFEDENISLNRPWFKKLLRAIIHNFGNASLELRAMNGLFPPTLDDESVSLMKDAGFRILNLSLGTTSKAQLNRFNRPDVTLYFEQALTLAETHRMEAVGYIIVGAPHQDPEKSVLDLLYLAQHRVLAGVSVFYPSPGSMDFDRCQDLGILPVVPSLYRSTALPISHKTDRRDAVTLLRLSRIVNFMKALIDQGINLPNPLPFNEARLKSITNKIEIGRMLVRFFLHDGKIRGITSTGQIYAHTVNTYLTHRFVEGLKDIKIRGCK
jgi:anaerobic magnesium-protoporphyrin IX monomethyl ester cyclase